MKWKITDLSVCYILRVSEDSSSSASSLIASLQLMSDRCGSSLAAVVAALMTIKMEDHILMLERGFAYGEFNLPPLANIFE